MTPYCENTALTFWLYISVFTWLQSPGTELHSALSDRVMAEVHSSLAWGIRVMSLLTHYHLGLLIKKLLRAAVVSMKGALRGYHRSEY